MNLRDFAAAGADLDRALAIVPDLALARATRSSVRLYLDDPTGALEDADWVIGNYSERGGRYNRLYVRLYSHEYDLAIEDSTWFVDRPDEVQKLARSLGYPAETVMADFLAYRGYAQLLKSQGGGGFDDMARSIETQPLRARAYIWRAHGYVLRSDLASAQTDLDAAVSNFQYEFQEFLDTQNLRGEMHYIQALVYHRQGRLDPALLEVRAGLSLVVLPSAREALEVLEQELRKGAAE